MVDTLGRLSQRTAASPAMEAADDAVGGAVNVANRLSALPGRTLPPPTGLGYGTTSVRPADVHAGLADLARTWACAWPASRSTTAGTSTTRR